MRGTRHLSTLLLICLAAAAFGCGPREEAPPPPPPPGEGQPTEAGGALTVASFGGAWQDAQRRAVFEPFAASSGVKVVDVEYDGAYEEVREKGAAGEWDVVDVEPVELLRGAAAGIYLPIDYSGIDEAALPEWARHPHGVALMNYAIVMGYDTAAFSDAASAPSPPSTWADFWDLERFPGQRALRSTPEWMLEVALLADGVPAEELYPLDLDRAFRSLAAIEEEVVFFDDWAAPAELLAAGEVAFAVGTNGRLAGARDAGESLDLSWSGGIVSSDYFVIPAGTENPERAQELVRYAVGGEAQAAFPRLIDYGPVNPRAFEALPPNVRLRLPSHPDHAAESVRFDAGWWLEHEDEAHERYDAWRQGLDGG
jgi:putative spermidine/putrescine transport system substrate-binding protein